MNVASSYNEAFDDLGSVRPAYRTFHSRTGHNPLAPGATLAAALTDRPLGDRYSILPTPLVLDESEYRTVIAPGVAQRALALQALFFDLIAGSSRVFRKTSLPEDLFVLILEQEGIAMADLAAWWEGKSREFVRFTYGPDLVRCPDGRWLILEDNLGCVGGVVDAELVLERFLEFIGTGLHPSIESRATLSRAVHEFLARVDRAPASGDVLAVLEEACAASDPEAPRKRQVLEALGMQIVDGSQMEAAERRGLRVHDAAAIVNFSTSIHTREWTLAGDLFGKSRVPLMSAPGVTALGNKTLLPFMDEIVAFYSGEPILRTAESHICRGMPEDRFDWVLKRGNGRQGREVFFLGGLSEAERRRLDAQLEAWGGPARAVVQRRVNASFLPGAPDAPSSRFQVELRPFVFVVGDSHCVAGDRICGRAFANADGRGLGNMSQGACYLAVIREPVSLAGSEPCTMDRRDRDAQVCGARAYAASESSVET